MAKKGVRLFKLASQINVGKDRIVSLLTAKGHEIQNKPTAMLTPDMVTIVMESFQKEAELAATIDSKMEAHRRVRQDEVDGEETADSAAPAATDATGETEAPAADSGADDSVAAEAAADEASSTVDTSSKSDEQAGGNGAAEAEAPAAQEPVEPAAETDAAAASEAEKPAEEKGAAVGTVINLDDNSKSRGRKTKRDKAKPKAEPVAEEATKAEAKPEVTEAVADVVSETPKAEAPAEEATKAEPKAKPKAKAKSKAKPKSKPKAEPLTEETPSPEPETLEPTATEEVEAKPKAEDKPAEEVQAADSPAEDGTADAETVKAQDETPEPSPESSPEPFSNSEDESDTAADEDSADDDHEDDDELTDEDATDEHDESDEDTDESGGKKRKRKRKIAEIEYQAGEAPTLKGLTILGKIDLVSKAKKKENSKKRSKPKDKEPDSGGALFAKRDKSSLDPSLLASTDSGGAAASGEDAGDAKGKRRRKKGKKVKVSQEEVDKAIRKTLSTADESGASSRSKMRQRRRQERAEEQERLREQEELEQQTLSVTEFITVAELANLMDTPTNEVILTCMTLGLMVSINQRLDKDTIMLIADDYGYEVDFVDELSDDSIVDEDDPEDTLKPRAPIVTIMGHVDHGKTSLLDYVRETNVVAGEAGGITQHIGAYKVKVGNDREIAFLDTPGHQAFTAMRARGAQVTDIVVLIVSADDSVMPQTKEAISHARAANVPIVVAINKIDRPESNADRIRQQLADIDVLVEDWGGKVQVAEISAKTGQNVDQLLEKILLEAELLDVKANPDRAARGTIIESKIDKGKGPVATAVIQKGTLNVGDAFLCGVYSGRVRAMLDERGQRVLTAGPSTPVQILGFDGAPQAGDQFVGMDSESEANKLSTKRMQIKREQAFKQIRHITLDDIASQIESGGVQDLPIILKADADGSVEALTDALQKLSTKEVRIAVIHKGVGAITESDIMLAAASNAIVIGFHIRPTPQAKRLAESEGVDIRIYRIIYDCINEIKLALEGLLRPEIKEEVSGTVEVRDVFKISKVGTIAGCYVSDGKIHRNDTVRLIRDGFDVFEGKISSLKRHKDDSKEVAQGYECGIGLENFNDIKVGDIIEAVKITKIKRKLETETEG